MSNFEKHKLVTSKPVRPKQGLRIKSYTDEVVADYSNNSMSMARIRFVCHPTKEAHANHPGNLYNTIGAPWLRIDRTSITEFTEDETKTLRSAGFTALPGQRFLKSISVVCIPYEVEGVEGTCVFAYTREFDVAKMEFIETLACTKSGSGKTDYLRVQGDTESIRIASSSIKMLKTMMAK